MQRTVFFLGFFLIWIFTLQANALTVSAPLSSGWNLINCPLHLNNSSLQNLMSPYQDKTQSFWKWTGEKWAVSLADGDTFDYAQKKGFAIFSDVKAGQGFWVNTSAPFDISFSGSLPFSPEMQAYPGWNLLGLKTDQTSSIENLFQNISSKPESVWAWKKNNWSVFLFDQDVSIYAQTKGFSVLSELSPTTGFWLNTGQTIDSFFPGLAACVYTFRDPHGLEPGAVALRVRIEHRPQERGHARGLPIRELYRTVVFTKPSGGGQHQIR
jgi:hypothetical protein